MPEVVNLFLKLNFAVTNYYKDINLYKDIFQTESFIYEGINTFILLLNKFQNQININKIKIIIPQLLICCQYDNTLLYNIATELLATYGETNIDLIAYLLSSFLNFKIDDLLNIGLNPNKEGDFDNNKFNNYSNSFIKSKIFASKIKYK
jgi:hypothetical protein